MVLLKRKRLAEQADRHQLYQDSVQDTEAEIDFVAETWAELRDRPAELLREDFCGTANTACEWIRRDPQHWAIGVDLDGEVLEWGRVNNLARLDAGQRDRIQILQENVLDCTPPLADIAMTRYFSWMPTEDTTRPAKSKKSASATGSPTSGNRLRSTPLTRR
jgi:hypothetical protein